MRFAIAEVTRTGRRGTLTAQQVREVRAAFAKGSTRLPVLDADDPNDKPIAYVRALSVVQRGATVHLEATVDDDRVFRGKRIGCARVAFDDEGNTILGGVWVASSAQVFDAREKHERLLSRAIRDPERRTKLANLRAHLEVTK